MTKIKKLVAAALAFLMVFGSVSLSAFAAETTTEGNLSITTKIFRNVNGTWQETEKVRRGEAVKARVYLTTSYHVGSGDLLFFYDSNFFEDSYGATASALTVNTEEYPATGSIYGSKSASTAAQDMADAGKITEEFLASHNYLMTIYAFDRGVTNQRFKASEWFCEYDLTVKADAATGSTGSLFAVKETARTPSFTAGKINVSKVARNADVGNAVDMAQWTAAITLKAQEVSLYENYVNVTFDANGGKIGDKTKVFYDGEVGTALTAPVPWRFDASFLGWAVKDTTNVVSVSELPAQNTEYVAIWDEMFSGDETVSFKTEIFRYDETKGEWIYTEKVRPGENVKARLYIDTNYYTNAGDVIVFYDNNFFTDTVTYDEHNTLSVNKTPGSSTALNNALGIWVKLPYSSNPEKTLGKMVGAGYITKDFVDTHTAYTINYAFSPNTGAKLDGDYWFAEFDLKVKDDASGTGNFLMVENTVQTVERQHAYCNIPLSTEGGELKDVVALSQQTVNIVVDDTHSVSTYSTITFDANGGMFANDEVEFVYPTDASVIANIGDEVNPALIPAVEKAGSTFVGWVPSNVEEPTEDDVVAIPATLGYEDLSFKAYWRGNVMITFVDHNNATTSITVPGGTAFAEVEAPAVKGHYFVGWTTDSKFETITGLPELYPMENTTYYAVYSIKSYETKYYVSAQGNNGFEAVGSIATEYGSPIVATPPIYTVPAGYTLSPAYTNPTLKTLLDEDATVPEGGITLYYALIPNTYNVTFDANGGKFADNSTSKVIPTKFEDRIVPPTAPTKEGYSFDGWSPEVGAFLDTPNAITYKATWAANTYNVLFYSEGDLYDSFPTEFGAEIDLPADPDREGYTFKKWSPELPETMPAETVVVNAVWEKNTYNVVFNAGEGSFKDGKKIELAAPYQDIIVPPAEEPTRTGGYAFLGWAKSTDESKTIITDFGRVGAEDVEYVAVWGSVSYTVTFWSYEVDGHKDITDSTFKYEHAQFRVVAGTPITLPEDPDSIENFVFKGWVDENGDPVEDGMAMPDRDFNVYADFERVAVKLIPKAGSATIVERDGAVEKNANNSVTPNRVNPKVDGNYEEWYIYGLKTGITETELLSTYIDVLGDGRIEVTPRKPGRNNATGTGTVVKVYDNVTDQVVENFYIIIYGDLDGDAFVNATDAAMVYDENLYVTLWSLPSSSQYVAYMVKAANIQKDTDIDQLDARLVYDHSLNAGIINQETGTIV